MPTRGAARLLHARPSTADIVTRDELYDRLHARLADPPRRLSPLERDVMAQAAARAAAAGVAELSFQLRPGLIAEMLRFYDQLRRQSQQVKRFEELIDEALGSDDVDRAAQRMRIQTRFLADAFRDYERRVRESGGCDEHTLRERLIAEPAADPVRHVVVTVPDWIADAEGLYQADFDLLTRIPGLESLDIVSTERVLASGFHERLHNWWPGLDEVSGGTHGRPEGLHYFRSDVALRVDVAGPGSDVAGSGSMSRGLRVGCRRVGCARPSSAWSRPACSVTPLVTQPALARRAVVDAPRPRGGARRDRAAAESGPPPRRGRCRSTVPRSSTSIRCRISTRAAEIFRRAPAFRTGCPTRCRWPRNRRRRRSI